MSTVQVRQTEAETYPCIPRARRFPIQVPVHFCARGERRWQQGMTVNISRTGVLFQAESAPAPGTMLLARIFFPAELTSGSPGSVVCRATVVRRERGDSADRGTTVAAAISSCRLLKNGHVV